jgi:hypothetical protein
MFKREFRNFLLMTLPSTSLSDDDAPSKAFQTQLHEFSADVALLCYAPDSQPTIFTHNLTKFWVFPSVLLVAGRSDLSSVTLSLPSEKRVTHL